MPQCALRTSILPLCLTNLFRTLDEYNKKGRWVGTGPENCTDPKRLREALTRTPNEHIVGVSINTFQGEIISFSANSSESFDSLWKTVDFVYDPVSFNRYDPIGNVQFYLHLSYIVQISFHFDEIFHRKFKIPILAMV